uniref:CW-type domain-containing protein n=1 Tax=Spongospora subterranea TaxID=70186 RepID=A0A0H5R0X1_9EUKA|eukprot:CRZ07835.1 hypothetical protein [Spongospora subterranea]
MVIGGHKADDRRPGCRIYLRKVGRSGGWMLRPEPSREFDSGSALLLRTKQQELIQVPSFNYTNLSKLCQIAESENEHEAVSDSVYKARHRPLELVEQEERRQMVPNQLDKWAVCENDRCRKWRRISSDLNVEASDIDYYCGNLPSPNAQECAVIDDWITECLGSALAQRCADLGVHSVDGILNHPKLIQRLNAIGVYYEPNTLALRLFEP